jgi:hypothetical protein
MCSNDSPTHRYAKNTKGTTHMAASVFTGAARGMAALGHAVWHGRSNAANSSRVSVQEVVGGGDNVV